MHLFKKCDIHLQATLKMPFANQFTSIMGFSETAFNEKKTEYGIMTSLITDLNDFKY